VTARAKVWNLNKDKAFKKTLAASASGAAAVFIKSLAGITN
jgi:hypothetical protein